MKDNSDNYSNPAVVSCYSGMTKLSPPEETILKLIKDKNRESMIDIGVGAGRTTRAFARLFKLYTGIDYSESMVETAKQKFKTNPEYNFLHCDARDMSVFTDSSFDFVMFSFNGIDCVSYIDRQKILSEIRRVGKPGSYFAFSTHNLYSVSVLFSFQCPKNPFKYLKEYKRFKGVRKFNPSAETILKNDYYAILDGDIDFKAEYIYYKPEKQISELKEHGFSDIRIFSLKTGNIFEQATKWDKVNDPWLYFLCKNNK